MSLSNRIENKIGILMGKLDAWKKADAMKKAYINVATEMIQHQIQHETQESAIQAALVEFQKNEQLKQSQLTVGVDLINDDTEDREDQILEATLKTAVDLIEDRENMERDTVHAILNTAIDMALVTQAQPTQATEELDEIDKIAYLLEQAARQEEKMFSIRDFLKYIIQAIKRFLRNLIVMVFPKIKPQTYLILLEKLLDMLRTFAEKNGIILEKDKDEKEQFLDVALQLLEPTRIEANQIMDIAIQLLNPNNTDDPTLRDRILALYNSLQQHIKDAKMDGFSLDTITDNIKSCLGQLFEIAVKTMPKMNLLEIRKFFNAVKSFNKILSKVDDEACIDKTSEICEKVIQRYPEINSDTIKMIGKIDDKCVFYDPKTNKTHGLDIIDSVECPDSA